MHDPIRLPIAPRLRPRLHCLLISNVSVARVIADWRGIRAVERGRTVLTVSAGVGRFRPILTFIPVLFGPRECSRQGGGHSHTNDGHVSSLAPDVSVSGTDLLFRLGVHGSWLKGRASPNQRTETQMLILATAQPLNSLLPLLQTHIFHQV